MPKPHNHTTRRLRLAAMLAIVVMALAVLGAPASAAKTRMTIVNGTSGKKLDVCVNGREIKKGLAYGRFVKTSVNKPRATVKFYPRKKGACSGRVLGKKVVKPARAVVVRTKKKPGRVLLFKEPNLPAPSAVVAYDVIGHGLNASELDRISFSVKFVAGSAIAMGGQSFDKGEQGRILNLQLGDDVLDSNVSAFQLPETFIAGPAAGVIRSFRYYQWLLVGAVPDDAKLIRLRRHMGLVEE